MSGRLSDFKMAPQIRSKESNTPGTSNRPSSRTSEFRRCGRWNSAKFTFSFSFSITPTGFQARLIVAPVVLPVGVTQDAVNGRNRDGETEAI